MRSPTAWWPHWSTVWTARGVRPGFIGEIGTERGHITPASERVSALSNDICQLGQLTIFGGVGYANVIENFLPMLRERGVSEHDSTG